jgi:hypothetical protein
LWYVAGIFLKVIFFVHFITIFPGGSMLRHVFGVVSLVVVFGINCSSPNKPEEASKYPAGYPQSVAEIAKICDTLPSAIAQVLPGYTEVGYQGIVAISLDSSGHGSVIVSACTASVAAHCTEKKTLYAETSSTFQPSVYSGLCRFYTSNGSSSGNSIVLIHGKNDGEGYPQETRLYIGNKLISGVKPFRIVSFMDGTKEVLILREEARVAFNSIYHYKTYDVMTGEILDYGEY